MQRGFISFFGWTDLTGIDDLRRQLQYDARYTEGYRNIICYTKPGLTEGSYLVYVSYDLKFKNSLTLAPGFLWNYVKPGADGMLYLSFDQELSEEERAFVSEAEKTDEIMLLRTQIYAKLRMVLESDAVLAENYGILEKKGGAAGANQEEESKEVNVQISGQNVVPEPSAEPSEGGIEGTPESMEGSLETDMIYIEQETSGQPTEPKLPDNSGEVSNEVPGSAEAQLSETGEVIPESQTEPNSEVTSADYAGENQ